MKQYRVRYLDEALAALKEAAAFIAERDGKERARNWLLDMLAFIEKLENSPSTWRQVTVLEGRVVRSFLVAPYRVYFVIEESASTVYVIDVVHTARESRLRMYETE